LSRSRATAAFSTLRLGQMGVASRSSSASSAWPKVVAISGWLPVSITAGAAARWHRRLARFQQDLPFSSRK
jgi:hypothetical protein